MESSVYLLVGSFVLSFFLSLTGCLVGWFVVCYVVSFFLSLVGWLIS
jgi:hypothetical protein